MADQNEFKYFIIAGVIILVLYFQNPPKLDNIESPYVATGKIALGMNNTISIAAWNLQIFGVKKSINDTIMERYVHIMDDYDIVIIQEIRDESGQAFNKLCNMMPAYNCLISSRAGRTLSQEQYGVLYKKIINVTGYADFNPDTNNRWERPPIYVNFSYNDYTFQVYTIHTKPEDVRNELNYLEDVVMNYSNVIIMGDLNADCGYYEPQLHRAFQGWDWIISDEMDTTAGNTVCAYDRIILNGDAKADMITWGIRRSDVSLDLSDHYLVWIQIKASI